MSSSVEKIPDIIDILSKLSPEIAMFPGPLAKKINTDPRTLIKILRVLVKLEIVDFIIIQTDNSVRRGFKLTDKYRKFILDK